MKQIFNLINYCKTTFKAIFLILFVALLLVEPFQTKEQTGIYTCYFPDPYDGFMPIQKYAAERLSDIPGHRSSLDFQMRDFYWASTTVYTWSGNIKKQSSEK